MWVAAPPLGPCWSFPVRGPHYGTFQNLLETSGTLPEIPELFRRLWKLLSFDEFYYPDASGAPRDV